MSRKEKKKFVKVCLDSSNAVQISLQFEDFFPTILRFEIFIPDFIFGHFHTFLVPNDVWCTKTG